jgi:ferric-dicitrate binding protein FerR (iron transport regulator)
MDLLCSVDVAAVRAEPRADFTYWDAESTTHVAVWLGNGRILHSTEREDVNGVLEEAEPPTLQAQRRRLIRLD